MLAPFQDVVSRRCGARDRGKCDVLLGSTICLHFKDVAVAIVSRSVALHHA